MLKKATSLILLIFTVTAAQAQFNFKLDQKLPMDPAVKQGILSNGMKYYIRKNVEPKDRADLYLAVNVGSTLENDEQQGLAHFMEHMQFNGTTNFPKNELVSFLQRSGLKFGADLNAYTSFDETVYQLPVPTDSADRFEKYFLVLSDWANKATLDHDEIDKERGVVLEESRLGKGAQSRIRDQLLPVVLKGSRYADRLPIGKDEILKNFKYEDLEAFYEKWYRPDLQAVIAVGDFDVAQVETYIKKYFGSIPTAVSPATRPTFDIPMDGSTTVKIITDAEQPYTMVQLYYKHLELKEITGNDRKQQIAISLFNAMMGARLQELLQKAEPPYQFGVSTYGVFLGGLDALTVIAVAKNGGVEKALKAVLEENQRAKIFGFTQTELDRAKAQYLAGREKQFNEKDKTASTSFTRELTQSFLKDVVMTDVGFDLDFAKQYIGGISLDEVNALVKTFITDKDRVAVIVAPEKEKDALPTEAQLIAWINENKEVTAYIDETLDQPLMTAQPVSGKVVNRKRNETIGVTELKLSNGVKVILKPTEFKNDEILFLASSKGGTSLYDLKDLDNASFGSAVASVSGLGDFSSVQLQKYMTGKIARVNAFVGEKTEGISGSSSVKDLETALQMLHVRLTKQRFDENAVKGFIGNQRDFVKSQDETPTPEKVYGDTLSAVMNNYSARSKPMTAERMDKLNPQKAQQFFADRFADADDFIYTFVGNFKEAEITPLLEKYIGSLPSKTGEENYQTFNDNPPAGLISKVVKKGTEDKATVSLFFTGKYDGEDKTASQIEALGDILGLKLIEKLREEEGGVYSPRVSASARDKPESTYQISVSFGCSPANVDKLIDITMQEIDKIKQNGAQESDIQKYKAEELLDVQEQLKSNRFWLTFLNNAYMKKKDPAKILDGEKTLQTISVVSTRKAANKFMSGKNVIKVILLPEN
jgi:zinc protease